MPVTSAAVAPMLISPFVALSAYGTMQSRSAVCAAAAGGGGAAGVGAVCPGYEPGLVYASPAVAGLQVSLGVYEPATIGNAQLKPKLSGSHTTFVSTPNSRSK